MQRSQTQEVELYENESLAEYAMRTPGLFINVLNLCGKDPASQKIKWQYIVQNKNMEGEKIDFDYNGRIVKATCIHSVLGTEYKNSKQAKKAFKKAVDGLIKDWREQQKIEKHIAGENYSLKELRKKGLLDE